MTSSNILIVYGLDKDTPLEIVFNEFKSKIKVNINYIKEG